MRITRSATLEGADPDRSGPTIRVAAIYGSPTAVIVMTPAIHIKEIPSEKGTTPGC